VLQEFSLDSTVKALPLFPELLLTVPWQMGILWAVAIIYIVFVGALLIGTAAYVRSLKARGRWVLWKVGDDANSCLPYQLIFL